MAQFTRYTAQEGETIQGLSLMSVIDNLMGEETAAIAEKHGFAEIDPDGWYSLQTYFDVVKEVEATIGSNGLTSIGVAVATGDAFPPEIESIESLLGGFGTLYEGAHRGGLPGEGWKAEFPQEGEAYLYGYHPYPTNLNYGIVWGALRRYLPEDYGYLVEVVERLEDNDGQYDLFHITWWPEEE